MELELEYFTLLIEKDFYEKNQALLGEDGMCNAKKKLPCNCLTGLIMNYWGYVVKNCQNIAINNTFEIVGEVSCIFTMYQGKKVVPIKYDENDNSEYWLSRKVCNMDEASREKIHIRETFFDTLGEMNKYISEAEPKCKRKMTEDITAYDFLSCFLIAVRTQPLERESKVLFAIMLFFFPNRTMKLVLDYLNSLKEGKKEKEFIKEFMNQYGLFLDELDLCNEYNFFARFPVVFEKLTGLYVGEWMEEVMRKRGNKRFWRYALVAAHNRNLEERKRRSSRYRKVLLACQ